MKIRSITYFCNPGWPLDPGIIRQAAQFASEARPAFENVGFEVQTVRLATPPFAQLLSDKKPDTVISFAQNLEVELTALGFQYIAIGPAMPHDLESYAALPEIIAGTDFTFASGVMASKEYGLSLPAVQACAEIIHALGSQDEVGFSNLYFAALANVPPGTPFFPAAYHDGGSPVFAIATEAADLAVTAFTRADNLIGAQNNLIDALEHNGKKLTSAAASLTDRFTDSMNLRFGGIDYSLAPFPELDLSLGTALERLGVSTAGLHGSLAAAAVITDAIDQANFPRTGFSGLMLPVLEDATLAARAEDGLLTVKDMLLYSTVCGTGLDTVPLPGDSTVEQLQAVLLDLAALSLRLDKPLTARLMPIPGKVAGDPTGFDFPFFANSRVMGLDAQPLTRHLSGTDQLLIRPSNKLS